MRSKLTFLHIEYQTRQIFNSPCFRIKPQVTRKLKYKKQMKINKLLFLQIGSVELMKYPLKQVLIRTFLTNGFIQNVIQK